MANAHNSDRPTRETDIADVPAQGDGDPNAGVHGDGGGLRSGVFDPQDGMVVGDRDVSETPIMSKLTRECAIHVLRQLSKEPHTIGRQLSSLLGIIDLLEKEPVAESWISPEEAPEGTICLIEYAAGGYDVGLKGGETWYSFWFCYSGEYRRTISLSEVGRVAKLNCRENKNAREEQSHD